jgi:hypothetical protein
MIPSAKIGFDVLKNSGKIDPRFNEFMSVKPNPRKESICPGETFNVPIEIIGGFDEKFHSPFIIVTVEGEPRKWYFQNILRCVNGSDGKQYRPLGLASTIMSEDGIDKTWEEILDSLKGKTIYTQVDRIERLDGKMVNLWNYYPN